MSAPSEVQQQMISSPPDHAPKLPSRIPSLDGLRAISIAAVIVSHLAETRGFSLHIRGLEHVGNFGVKVFFVISGFLITTLLLKEQVKTDEISLKKFYLRRVIRIFPAFYLYVGAMSLLGVLGLVEHHPMARAADSLIAPGRFHHPS